MSPFTFWWSQEELLFASFYLSIEVDSTFYFAAILEIE